MVTMQTKIVYILISNEQDYYLEQLYLSLFSLRLHNPDASVILLTDDRTKETLVGKRSQILEYLTEAIVVDVPRQYSSKERSRFIKTTYRKYVSGNLLFIDTDTIIAEDLSEIDNCEAEVACVLDYHAPLDSLIDGDAIRKRIFSIFGEDVSDELLYFNSGVMFVKDTPRVYRFFDAWNEYWKHAAFIKHQCFDQPSLMMANRKSGHLIQELDGIYNCQILTSIQYLHHAKVLHFFNNSWEGKAELSPFFQEEVYQQIKNTGEIPDSIKEYIHDCRSAFFSPSYFTCKLRNEFLQTLVGATLYSDFQKNGFLFRFVNFLCTIRYSFVKKIVHA